AHYPAPRHLPPPRRRRPGPRQKLHLDQQRQRFLQGHPRLGRQRASLASVPLLELALRQPRLLQGHLGPVQRQHGRGHQRRHPIHRLPVQRRGPRGVPGHLLRAVVPVRGDAGEILDGQLHALARLAHGQLLRSEQSQLRKRGHRVEHRRVLQVQRGQATEPKVLKVGLSGIGLLGGVASFLPS
ncbi:hypothetical protein DFJ73DRAFT_915397, partial [Zopfochytrium polystomum]